MKLINKTIYKLKKAIHPYAIKAMYYLPYIPLLNKHVGSCELGIEGNYLVATKRGLYQIYDGKLYLILRGNYYGLTYSGNYIYAFERMSKKGRLLRLTMNSKYKITKAEIYMKNMSPGCHQIDVRGGLLYVCDTYNNRVFGMGLRDKEVKYETFPFGKLSNGRKSDNYAHINSIYISDDGVTLFCHNETKKTGRSSQIITLGDDRSVKRTITTTAGSGHNVTPLGDSYLYCDSMNGTLKLGDQSGDKTIFDAKCFTRGLSLTKDYIIMGGSEYASRDQRDYGKGYIFLLDKKDFKCHFSMKFPAMVQEIRRLDDIDYAMSKDGKKS